MICPDCSFALAGIIWRSFLILKCWVASPSAAVCACVGVRGGGWLTAAHRRLHGRAPLCCLRLTKNPSFTATRAEPLRSGAWRLLLGVSLWWSAASRPCFSSSSSREQMKHVLVVTLWQGRSRGWLLVSCADFSAWNPAVEATGSSACVGVVI